MEKKKTIRELTNEINELNKDFGGLGLAHVSLKSTVEAIFSVLDEQQKNNYIESLSKINCNQNWNTVMSILPREYSVDKSEEHVISKSDIVVVFSTNHSGKYQITQNPIVLVEEGSPTIGKKVNETVLLNEHVRVSIMGVLKVKQP
jgi:hypothetical protein